MLIELFRAVRRTAVPCALFFFFILPLSSVGQSGTSGSIAGIVVAPDGQVVPSAKVTLSAYDGPSHVTSTGSDGAFLFQNLASADYSLQVESQGFVVWQQPAVAVAVGRTTHLSIQLTVAGAQSSVTVTAAESAFDTSQTSSVVNIDRDRVEELPIPSRNYLTFVQLSPQAAPSNPALQAPGVTPSAGSFSFGGLRPGSNSVYIDGVNDNDEYSGSSRTQLSPEAISDFQIVNHGFAAEAGGGAGGSVDVQTRTGVNRIHGDAFTFVQNGALNAAPPLELLPRRPDESRMRAGVALGGPIRRDRTYYYAAAEQEMGRGEDANDLSGATLAALRSGVARYQPLSGLTLASGFFPTTDQETELSARIDQTLTPRHALMLRYAFTNGRNVNDAFNTDDLTDLSARGSSFVADNSLNGTLTSSFGTNVLNALSFELAQRRDVARTENSTGPGILIAGEALLGTPYFGNSRHFETHVEFADTLSIQRGAHLFQLGARADRVKLRAHTPDGAQGLFVFPTISAFESGRADFFAQSFGNFDTNFAAPRIAAYAQDHWTRSGKLTFDYGVRYEYNRLPSSLPQDALNFSPRFGVAYTPWKKLVVRGGFGIFYDRFLLATVDRLVQQDGTRAFGQIEEDAPAAALFASNAVLGAPIPGVAPGIWRAQPGLRNPYSEVASLSAEQSLPWQTTLSGEYQFVHGVHLGRTTNINLPPPVVVTAANAASLGITSPAAQQLGQPAFSMARLNPAFDAINEFATSAGSSYSGGTITLNRQFQDDFEIMAGYSYSKTFDDASSDFEQPRNPYVLGDERALSLQDQRQRFTLSGLWLIGPDIGDPADAAKNANPGPLMKALYGFEFAPIASIGTGFRTDPVVGLDSSREHIFPFAARPAGYARNSLATPANVDFDLRILRMVALGSGHLDIVAESFNLLNHKNVAEIDAAYGESSNPMPEFSQPIAASASRQIQFSLDYEF